MIFRIALGLLLASSCRTLAKLDSSEVQVANGDIVNSGRVLSSTVALILDGNQFCTGTLLEKGIVISAAHCFSGMEKQFEEKGLQIAFGTGPNYDAVLPVERVFFHQRYALLPILQSAAEEYRALHPQDFRRYEELKKREADTTLTSPQRIELSQLEAPFMAFVLPKLANPNRPVNDVAILKFKGTPPAYGQSVRIAGDDVQLHPSDHMLAAGYGLTSSDDLNSNGVLMSASVQLGHFNPEGLELTTLPLEGSGTCKGDSGGPLYVSQGGGLSVIGSVSRSADRKPCGRDNSVYTDLRSHIPWITCQTERLNGASASHCSETFLAAVEIIPMQSSEPIGPDANGQCLSLAEMIETALYKVTLDNGGSLDFAKAQRHKSLQLRFQQHGACQGGTGSTGNPGTLTDADYVVGVGLSNVAANGGNWVLEQNVTPGGKAARAGVLANDFIMRLNGSSLHFIADFDERLASLRQQRVTELTLVVWRNGVSLTITIPIAPNSDSIGIPGGALTDADYRLGFGLNDVAANGGHWVQVTSVTNGGKAASAGIFFNDYVLKLDGNSVHSVAEFDSVMSGLKARRVNPVVLNIWRNGVTIVVRIPIGR